MHRKRTSAFTLVELLVVVSIIAVLISMMIPAIGQARESARRAVCAANLRGWGQIAHMFAGDQKGLLPVAHSRGNSTATGRVSIPVWILQDMNRSYGIAGLTDEQKWKGYGTPITMLREYGLNDGNLPSAPDSTRIPHPQLRKSILGCPSSTNDVLTYRIDAFQGSIMFSNYSYVGGLKKSYYIDAGSSLIGWNESADDPRRPAVTANDDGLAVRSLAADVVLYATVAQYNNHGVVRTGPTVATFKPVFQNILYGDGTVRSLSDRSFPTSQTTTTYAARDPFATPSYYYWGQ